MANLANLRWTVWSALALWGFGCSPPTYLRPDTPQANWANNDGNNLSPNLTDLGKSAGPSTDDRTGATSAMAQPAITAVRGQNLSPKQFPLKREDMLIMPALAAAPVPPADGGEVQPVWHRSDEKPGVLPNTMLPEPAPTNADGKKTPPPPAKEMPKTELPPPPPGKPWPPYLRHTPTATGEILNLAPHEHATERAVELSFKVSALDAENRLMFSRIKQMEADLDARDRALGESAGEIEKATSEITRARGELQTLRREVMSLRERLRQAEREDIETLRSVIAALEKLLEPPRSNGSKE